MADPAKAKASTLSQIVLRNLGDRSYEKRKSAALEIESLIKELNQKAAQSTIPEQKEDELNKIRGAISMLVNSYAYSTQANYRKGGLIGLAATAIALMDDTQHYLPMLLPPVLKCFQDQEARVRYYACEALYNITKVARGHVLVYFNEIFDGLCTLYSDKEVDVKNGAQLLDRLLKDVVTESEAFDVEKFIPLLRERIRIKDPFIRQLIVGWITVLDSVPEIDILQFLPEYLSGLFDMLSDPNKDIRQQAYAALAEFLKEITSAVNVELGPMVMILVTQCESVDNFTRLTALTWMYEFIQLGQTKLLPFVASCLGACLHCISDSEEEIRIKAEATNNTLLALVDGTQERFDIPPVLTKLTTQVRNKWVPTRLASLRWIAMLLTKMPETIYKFLDDLFPALLATLSDPDEQVVRLDLEVLARISLNSANFDMVLHNVMKLFAADRKLLETRGSLIIRQLCCLLNGESIYRALAKILHPSNFSKDKDSASAAPAASSPSSGTPAASPSGSGVQQDVEFASLMVQTLNIILLTASELFELRSLLKQSLYTQQGRDLFVTLYTSWAHNPVATFSLCLLAQAYELASALAFQLADIEVTVGFLMQIDKLVQLIESPIFIHLRLQLLEPNQHPFLLKSLYGLLMLLPQSSAFTALKTRLESVAPLGSLTCIPDSKFAVSRNPAAKLQETKQLNFQELLDQFKVTQQLHSQFRKEVFHQSSLLSATKDPEEKKSQK